MAINDSSISDAIIVISRSIMVWPNALWSINRFSVEDLARKLIASNTCALYTMQLLNQIKVNIGDYRLVVDSQEINLCILIVAGSVSFMLLRCLWQLISSCHSYIIQLPTQLHHSVKSKI